MGVADGGRGARGGRWAAQPPRAAAALGRRLGRIGAARGLGIGGAVRGGRRAGRRPLRGGGRRAARPERVAHPGRDRRVWPTPGPAPRARRWPGCTRSLPPAWSTVELLGRPTRRSRAAGHAGRRPGRDARPRRSWSPAIVHGEMLSLDAFAPVVRDRGPRGRAADLDRPGPRPEVAGGARGRPSRTARRLRRAALDAYASGDVGEWVRHCSAAVVAGAREAIAICEAILRG